MRYILPCLIIIIFSSCNSQDKKADQQNTIDSLTNVINQKDEKDKKEKLDKENQQKLQDIITERNAVLSKVTTDKPAFTSLILGGLKDIRFNLFNDFKYNLEQVVLKVHYIKGNGMEIKSETQILNNIAANSRKSLTSPDYTFAGSFLNVTIETVLCKSINLCYYNSSDSVVSNDPYKCR